MLDFGDRDKRIPPANLTMTYNEDAFLESQYEERTECFYEEDAPDWFWGPDSELEDEDEDEGEEFAEDEISYEERFACDLYNERYSYPYCD